MRLSKKRYASSSLIYHSETGTIHLLDTQKQLLHLTAQMVLPPQIIDIVKTIPVGKGIAGQTAAQDKPVTICHLQTDTSGVAKAGARQTGVGGALCVRPFVKDGKIVGMIWHRHHAPALMDAGGGTQRLEDIANLVGTYISE